MPEDLEINVADKISCEYKQKKAAFVKMHQFWFNFTNKL